MNRDKIVSAVIGGAQPNLSKQIIESPILLAPTEEVLVRRPFVEVMNFREVLTREKENLNKMKELLLYKMTKVELEKEREVL